MPRSWEGRTPSRLGASWYRIGSPFLRAGGLCYRGVRASLWPCRATSPGPRYHRPRHKHHRSKGRATGRDRSVRHRGQQPWARDGHADRGLRHDSGERNVRGGFSWRNAHGASGDLAGGAQARLRGSRPGLLGRGSPAPGGTRRSGCPGVECGNRLGHVARPCPREQLRPAPHHGGGDPARPPDRQTGRGFGW